MNSTDVSLEFLNHANPSWIEGDTFIRQIQDWGATLAGIGDVRAGLAKEFKHLPTAISMAIEHPPVTECLVEEKGVMAYTNQFLMIDARLEKIQQKTARFLRSQGWKAFVIPPDTDKQDPRFAARLYYLFPHKTAATCAGLGWVGKNGLLVTRAYGARLSWATVLTDAPLTVCDAPYLVGQCKACQRCAEICPAQAISAEEWVRESSGQSKIDTRACAAQLGENYQALGSYICGLCIMVCPLCRK